MKPVTVKCSTYFDFNEENNYEDHKFEVSDHVRISKYKNVFVKGYVPRQSKEVFVIKKSKNHCVADIFYQCDLSVKEVVRMFYKKKKKKMEKTNQKELKK